MRDSDFACHFWRWDQIENTFWDLVIFSIFFYHHIVLGPHKTLLFPWRTEFHVSWNQIANRIYSYHHTGQSVLDFRHHCKESSEITWSTQTLPSIAKFVVWINFAFSQIEKACPHRKTTKIIYEHLSYLCKSKFYISKEYYIMFAFIWNHFHIEKTVFLFMSLRFRIIVMWRILLFFLQLWR